MKPIKSKTRAKELRRALPSSELNARIARVDVLFEDLRIESSGIVARSLGPLDYTDKKYRGLYFFRRAIATAVEFRGALVRLNSREDFKSIKDQFNNQDAKRWNEAITFFEQNKGILKTVRDDVGGHFQETAAERALANLSSEIVGMMEIVKGEKRGAGPKMHFAGDIVLTAITAHKGSKTEEQFFEEIVTLLRDAIKHATKPVHLISAYYLWNRFAG